MAESAEKKEKTKKEGKTRQPSALKRDLQNQKKRLRNRSYKAEVLTAIRSLTKETAPEKLSAIYSLMDKGVKRGVFKPGKAARTKSRLAARVR